jgi:hypothetical protein
MTCRPTRPSQWTGLTCSLPRCATSLRALSPALVTRLADRLLLGPSLKVVSNYRASLLAHKGEEGARQMVEEWLNPAQGVSWLVRPGSFVLVPRSRLLTDDSTPSPSGPNPCHGPHTRLIISSVLKRSDQALGRVRPFCESLSAARTCASRCRSTGTSTDQPVSQRAETELEYSDSVTLAISTGLVINFPRPRFAVLPISLGVTLVGLHGTVRPQVLIGAGSQATCQLTSIPSRTPR